MSKDRIWLVLYPTSWHCWCPDFEMHFWLVLSPFSGGDHKGLCSANHVKHFFKYDLLIKSPWSHDGLSAHPEERSCSGAFLTGNGVMWGVSWLDNAKNTSWHPSCPHSCSSWDESEQSQIVFLHCPALPSPHHLRQENCSAGSSACQPDAPLATARGVPKNFSFLLMSLQFALCLIQLALVCYPWEMKQGE